MNDGPVTMTGGLVKIVVDLLITTLPIPLILRMNMQKRQRFLVIVLLGLGYIVTAAGAVRVYFTWKAFYDTNDQVWYQYPAFIAAALENNLAIVCPQLLPPFPRANESRFVHAFQPYGHCSLIFSVGPFPGYETGCLQNLHQSRTQKLIRAGPKAHGSLEIGPKTAAMASTSSLSLHRSRAVPFLAKRKISSYSKPSPSSSARKRYTMKASDLAV
jgi:hypothetical protein